MCQITSDLLGYIVHNEVQQYLKNNKDMELKMKNLSLDILKEIQSVLWKHEELSDFEIVENIVTVMEKYNLDCGDCHDFG